MAIFLGGEIVFRGDFSYREFRRTRGSELINVLALGGRFFIKRDIRKNNYLPIHTLTRIENNYGDRKMIGSSSKYYIVRIRGRDL